MNYEILSLIARDTHELTMEVMKGQPECGLPPNSLVRGRVSTGALGLPMGMGIQIAGVAFEVIDSPLMFWTLSLLPSSVSGVS